VAVTNDYDANSRVSQRTYANSGTIQFAYTLDVNGKVTSTNVTDQGGNVRQVGFNAMGLITTDTYPLGQPEAETVTFSRNATSGLLNSTTDALGRTTAFTYDSFGNMNHPPV
jgi:hypothetical protein